MKNVLSIYFEEDRIYLALLGHDTNGISLKKISSLDESVDFESYSLEDQTRENILDWLSYYATEADYITATLPTDSVIVSQMPADIDGEKETLREVIKSEITNTYPDFSPENYVADIVKLVKPDSQDSEYVLSIIYASDIISNCINLLSPLGLDIQNVGISQLNSHSAFFYNYPEYFDDSNIIIGVQEQFMDISIVRSGETIHYNLLSYNEVNDIPSIVEKSLSGFKEKYGEISNCMMFGKGLNKGILEGIKKRNLSGVNVARLNAFRKVIPLVTDREKLYASRTQHIFPPIIGSSFKPYSDVVRFI
ncbi:MAG: hypothetical protein Kapaf2KO_07260 [Candidatus Kapaibacteriales bacterium]